jgi:hypothetical protein
MAGRGPAPKPAATRRRRNADPVPAVKVEVDGELRGFPLPEGVLPDGDEWHPMTRRWWDVWRSAPQAQTMLGTDWETLLETAVLHHVLWSKGRWEHASEVRLRVGKLGATAEDRMRLRMEVPLPGDSPKRSASDPGSVTDISSRRARLSG